MAMTSVNRAESAVTATASVITFHHKIPLELIVIIAKVGAAILGFENLIDIALKSSL